MLSNIIETLEFIFTERARQKRVISRWKNRHKIGFAQLQAPPPPVPPLPLKPGSVNLRKTTGRRSISDIKKELDVFEPWTTLSYNSAYTNAQHKQLYTYFKDNELSVSLVMNDPDRKPFSEAGSFFVAVYYVKFDVDQNSHVLDIEIQGFTNDNHFHYDARLDLRIASTNQDYELTPAFIEKELLHILKLKYKAIKQGTDSGKPTILKSIICSPTKKEELTPTQIENLLDEPWLDLYNSYNKERVIPQVEPGDRYNEGIYDRIPLKRSPVDRTYYIPKAPTFLDKISHRMPSPIKFPDIVPKPKPKDKGNNRVEKLFVNEGGYIKFQLVEQLDIIPDEMDFRDVTLTLLQVEVKYTGRSYFDCMSPDKGNCIIEATFSKDGSVISKTLFHLNFNKSPYSFAYHQLKEMIINKISETDQMAMFNGHNALITQDGKVNDIMPMQIP